MPPTQFKLKTDEKTIARSRAEFYDFAKAANLDVRRSPIRSSTVGLLRECPRKMLLMVRIGLKRLGKKSGALAVGTHYHHFMEGLMTHWKNGDFDPEAAGLFASQKLTEQSEEWKKLADDIGIMPDGKILADLVAESEREFALAHVMFAVTCERLNWDFFKDWDVLEVEQPSEIAVRGLNAPIRCKPDAVFYRKADNRLLIIDWKTTSGDTTDRVAMAEWEIQPQLERLCLSVSKPESVPAFFSHIIIKKTTLRYPAKKYPTFEDYRKAVVKWYEGQQVKDPDKPPFLFSNMALLGPVMPLETFVQLRRASQACRCPGSLATFHRTDSACMGRFGKTPCPYLRLCRSQLSEWPDLIQKHYTQDFREDEEVVL